MTMTGPNLKGLRGTKITGSISYTLVTEAMVGGCGWKSTAPKVIWFPSIFELLFERSKKAVESMIPTSKVPTVGANWRGLTRQMFCMIDLGLGERMSDELEGRILDK
jgi:hypothetical protein